MEFIVNSSTQLSALIYGRTKINQKQWSISDKVDLSVYQIGIKSVSDFITTSVNVNEFTVIYHTSFLLQNHTMW